jgi:hypothetical protein
MMFAARANLNRDSGVYRAESEAGDFAYEPRHLATTTSER